MDRRIVNATAAPAILRALLQKQRATTSQLNEILQYDTPQRLCTRLLNLVEKGLVRRERNLAPGKTRGSRSNPDIWSIPNEARVREWLAEYDQATTVDTTFGDNPFEPLQAIFGVAVRTLNHLPGRQHALGVGVTEL